METEDKKKIKSLEDYIIILLEDNLNLRKEKKALIQELKNQKEATMLFYNKLNNNDNKKQNEKII